MSFAYGTPIAGPTGFKPVETYAVGDEALGARMESGVPAWTPQDVAFSNGAPPGPAEFTMVYLAWGDEGALIVTVDQSFLLNDGTLKCASYLAPGERLVGADGGTLTLERVEIGRFQGGVHTIALAPTQWSGTPDGHLLNAGGVVAGDYVADQHAAKAAGAAENPSAPSAATGSIACD